MSDLAISPVSNAQLQFKGVKRTENGNTYYNTHRGTTLGIFTGIPTAAVVASPAIGVHAYSRLGAPEKLHIEQTAKDLIKTASEAMKQAIPNGTEDEASAKLIKWLDHPDCLIRKAKSSIKSLSKTSIYAAIGTAVLAIGSGIVADSIRNKKAKATADAIASGDTEGNKNVAYSKNGNQYCKTKVGSTMGFLLGAGAAGAIAVAKKSKNPVGIAASVLSGALSGWLLGKLNDHGVNKKAARKADEVAFAQNS